jgi:oligoendopeptidase F
MARNPTDAGRWNLSDLYASPTDTRLGDDLGSANALGDTFAAAYRGKVALMSPTEMGEALRLYEQLLDSVYRPQLYAQLLFSSDTGDEAAQALMNRTQQASTETLNKVRFFDVELKKLPEDGFGALLRSQELVPYRHFLAGLRRFAPHTLSEAEETLSEVKNLTGRTAFSQLYTEVSSRIRIPVEVEGKTQTLTVAEVRALRSSPDRALRRRATDGLMKAFEEQSHVLNFCFNTLFQDHRLDIQQRGFDSPAEPTYLEDELGTEVVEQLMATTEKHYPLVERYMRLKAKVLKIPEFASHDVLAPLVTEETKLNFGEGKRLVLEAFGAFHPRFQEIANEFFEKAWIDIFPRPGKRDGAFCSGMLPALHPYVLLNYNDRLEDVSTLAHELGHGIHFYLSRGQSILNFWPTTPMAETASVFAELVLMRRLLDQEKDPTVRRNLLALRIEDIIATVCNQVMYTRWEQKAHARRADGVVPVEEFANLWLEERKKLYGGAVRFEPQDRWGWLSIGHFVHYRFYCYSYAFGQLLVLALFNKYEEDPKAFVPKYAELLSSGSSDTPQALLKKMGIDIEAPTFWAQGFVTLGSLIDEFERLT